MNATTKSIVKILLTRREAAKALAISEATLDRFTKSGTIPCVRIGGRVLYPSLSLEQWANSAATKAE